MWLFLQATWAPCPWLQHSAWKSRRAFSDRVLLSVKFLEIGKSLRNFFHSSLLLLLSHPFLNPPCCLLQFTEGFARVVFPF